MRKNLRRAPDDRDYEDMHGDIAGYFGNLYEIRGEAEARRWLKNHLPKNQWEWFQQHEHSWRQSIESLEKDYPAHPSASKPKQRLKIKITD